VSALAWWLIPLVATVLAVAFVALRSRPAKPTTAEDSMARLRRMQEAMERPMPPQAVLGEPTSEAKKTGGSDE
jgi:hypothetical protein